MKYTYSQARNPVYADPDGNYIVLEVNFDHLDDEWVPCSVALDPRGGEEHIDDLYRRAVAGDFGEVAPWVSPTAPLEGGLDNIIRPARDFLLKQSDLYVLPDRWAAMTEEKQAEWTTYRQALRDFPASLTEDITWDDDAGDWDINWPEAPST